MDFRVVTIVVILSLTSPVHGRILKRDTSQRATCTAPVATKGDTAVVTCHYPLEVKQPGEIVSVTVEHYPSISSSAGSDYLLDCMWNEDLTCSWEKAEHRVEGKDVVIAINNVTEDNQGRYLCKMMVKDGPNIHGDPCLLLLNGTSPSDLTPSTTDPALDQPTTTDNVISSAAQTPAGKIAAIVVGCAVAVAAVVGVAVCVCRRRRAGVSACMCTCVGKRRPPKGDQPLEEEENQLVQDPNLERQGAEDQGNNDDDNRGKRHPVKGDQPLEGGGNQLVQDPNLQRHGAEDQGNNDDDSRGAGSQETRTERQRQPRAAGGGNQLPPRDHGSKDYANNGAGPQKTQTQTENKTDTDTVTEPRIKGEEDQHLLPSQKSPGSLDHGIEDEDKSGAGPQETWTETEPLLDQRDDPHPYPHQKSPGTPNDGSEDDDNSGTEPQETETETEPLLDRRDDPHTYPHQKSPETPNDGSEDDDNSGAEPQETGTEPLLDQRDDPHPHPHQKSPGTPNDGSEDDDNSGAGLQETWTETEPLLDQKDDPHPQPGQKSHGPLDDASEDDGNRMEESSENPHKRTVKRLTAHYEQKAAGDPSFWSTEGELKKEDEENQEGKEEDKEDEEEGRRKSERQ